MHARSTTVILLLAATAPAALAACDARAGDEAKRAAMTFRAATSTACRAGGAQGTEAGVSTVTIAGGTITLGADDEALAGIALPCTIDAGTIAVAPRTVATGEPFGDVSFGGLQGTIAGGTLSFTYRFKALDVTCTVTGAGKAARQGEYTM
jgi:hypothetical protein